MMTNYEFYKDELIKHRIAGNSLAIKENNEIAACENTYCSSCIFKNEHGLCRQKRMKWLNEEYQEPIVDWSKVKVDTPVIVSDYEDFRISYPRYFAKYEDGKTYVFAQGRTSFTSQAKDDRKVKYEYIKLAEVDNDN